MDDSIKVSTAERIFEFAEKDSDDGGKSHNFKIEDDDDWDDVAEGKDKVIGHLNFRPTSSGVQSYQRKPTKKINESPLDIDEEFESILVRTVTDDVLPTHEYLSNARKTFVSQNNQGLISEDYAKTDSVFN